MNDPYFNRLPNSADISIRQHIESSMKLIGVNFRFYDPETPGTKFKWTPLMGPAKKRRFLNLYHIMREKDPSNNTIKLFEMQA
ncbi:6764_t:CDS:2 [Gigaspora margarita]|uniref:6764_t:CDS:1 n=1 Tax=Gigaspora margarita TaxID=4874 RepID=A0ABN7WBQ1_GIGMA|nr:6764_t:CDS:2 [Gigaspora margarita]